MPAKILKVATRVSIDELDPVDAGSISRDGLQRIDTVVVHYQSITCTYVVPWDGTNITVTGMVVPTIEDAQ